MRYWSSRTFIRRHKGLPCCGVWLVPIKPSGLRCTREKSGLILDIDIYVRIGGATGLQLQTSDCPKLLGLVNPDCITALLLFHMISSGSGYFENMWVWTVGAWLSELTSISNEH